MAQSEFRFINLRSCFSVLLLAFLGLSGRAHAQVPGSPAGVPELRAVPAGAAPRTGTFYSLQRPSYPPLPFDPFPDLPLYTTGDGCFLVDDSAVDYPTPDPEALAAALTRSLAGASSGLVATPQGGSQVPGGYSPNPSPPCGDGSTPWLAEFASTLESNGTATVSFRIAGGSNGVAYAIYRTADLTNSLVTGQWTWLGQGYACHDYTFSNQPPADAFYTLGPPPLTMTVAWGDDSLGQCDVPVALTNAVAVAGGWYHSIALLADGSVTTWGQTNFVANSVPPDLPSAQAIAASWGHNVALLADGTVRAWGLQGGGGVNWGLTNVPAGLEDVKAIAAGGYHTLALKADGKVVAWGAGHGENDMFNFGQSIVPAGLTNVIAIAAGGFHSLALRADGTLVGWGDSAFGETNAPSGATNLTAIAAGWMHNVALKQDGTVIAWGYNAQGQTNVPAGLSNVVAVAAGYAYSLALKNDGSIVVWGDGPACNLPFGLDGVATISAGPRHALAIRYGHYAPVFFQQPAGQWATNGQTITFVASARGFSSVSYQWQFNGTNLVGATNATLTVAGVQISHDGDYQVIASNGAGSSVSPVAKLSVLTPPVFNSQTPAADATLVDGSTVTLRVDATARHADLYPLHYQWLLNAYPIFHMDGTNYTTVGGTNYTITNATAATMGTYVVVITNLAGSTGVVWTLRVTPPGAPLWWGSTTQAWDYLPGVSNTIALAGGGHHQLLLTEEAKVLGWGANDFGQTNVPGGLTNAVAIAAGQAHSLALRADGTVLGWGRNDFGQTNTDSVSGVRAIAAGGHQSLALLSDGTVVQWGQTNAAIPLGLSSVAAIASGTNFHLALLSNSTVVVWGSTNSGRASIPQGLSNVVAIAAGGAHALALCEDGHVVAWGSNTRQESSVPADLANAMAIAAGDTFSLALRNDGTVVAWGDNTSGQTNVPPELGHVKLIAAGGERALASQFSTLVQYPVDVTKDLLLIYNTNSLDSSNVCAYYLAHRPMVSAANVLGIDCPATETIYPWDYTNTVQAQLYSWLTANPTRRPQYVVLFLDMPSRVNGYGTNNYYMTNTFPSVSVMIHSNWPGIRPFVTHINMGDTNACRAYIDKLAWCGASNSPGRLILSASVGGYANTNYYFDDAQRLYPNETPGATASDAVVRAGAHRSAVAYLAGNEHITGGANVAGYLTWGANGAQGAFYYTNVHFCGNSRWYIIQTIESFNGQKCQADQGKFTQWFSALAFGGSDYRDTPVGAVTHIDEPGGAWNDSARYFGLWAEGRNFGICAWESRVTVFFQAVGDPLVRR